MFFKTATIQQLNRMINHLLNCYLLKSVEIRLFKFSNCEIIYSTAFAVSKCENKKLTKQKVSSENGGNLGILSSFRLQS